ncbi:MAG: ankyrin repeat domain-containing protein [Legionella sp.]|nr:ankyrin repeat domain-containing protein [Legionella sp.]
MFVVTLFPVTFEMVIESTTEWSENIFKQFAQSGIKTPFVKDFSTNTHKIYLNDELDVLKAGIICLKHYAFTDDYEYDSTLEKISSVFHKIQKTVPLEIQHQFLEILYQKLKDLKDIQYQLNSLAHQSYNKSSAYDNIHAQSSEEITANIKEIINYNQTLFTSLNQKAHNQCAHYNSVAIKALVMTISSSYLENNHPETLSQAKEAYSNHLASRKLANQTIQNLTSPIYPYIDAELEFPVSKQSKESVTVDDVTQLAYKISRLEKNLDEMSYHLIKTTNFYQVIKQFFNVIYQTIMKWLGKRSSDLAKNVDNIVNGVNVTRRAEELHQFNSQPAPLISIIHSELAQEIKVDLISKLAPIKPFRFIGEPNASINLEIDSDNPKESNSKPFKRSPLHHAVEFGSDEIVVQLLTLGANPNSSGCIHFKNNIPISGEQVTPLHIAATRGDIEKMNLLLSSNASVNASNKREQTPLHAARNGDVVDLLLKNTANINAQDCDGKSPLHQAISRNAFDVVNALLNKTEINIECNDKHGNTPLHYAVEFSTPEMIDLLLKFGADVNASNNKGQTPLHKAASRNNASIVTRLLEENKIDVDSRDNRGNTPLHYAAHKGVAVVKSNTTLTNVFFKALISQTIQESGRHANMNILEQITSKGADINAVNDLNYNSLHMALNTRFNSLGEGSVQNPDLKHMKDKVLFLCQKGANVNCKTHPQCSNKTNISNLISHPTSGATPLIALYQAKEIIDDESSQILIKEIAETLVGFGADPKQRDEQEKSLLHACAHNGDAIGLNYFLTLGLDPDDQPSPDKPTPLHELFSSMTVDFLFPHRGKPCLDLLFAAGCNPDKPIIIKINAETIPFLSKSSIHILLQTDNIISRNASQLKSSLLNQYEIIQKIWRELGKPSLEIELCITPENYGSNSRFLKPCTDAIEAIKQYRKELQDITREKPMDSVKPYF